MCVPTIDSLVQTGGVLDTRGHLITDIAEIATVTSNEYTPDHPILAHDGVVFDAKKVGLARKSTVILFYKNLLNDHRLSYTLHPQRISFMCKTQSDKMINIKDAVDVLKLLVKNEAESNGINNIIFAPAIIVSSTLISAIDSKR